MTQDICSVRFAATPSEAAHTRLVVIARAASQSGVAQLSTEEGVEALLGTASERCIRASLDLGAGVYSRSRSAIQIPQDQIREAALDDVISGAYVFTGERSAHSYHLNKMANTLSQPEKRARFQADEAGYMRAMGCSDHEIDLVHRRDWKAMMAHGASIYLLLKIGAATGHALPTIGAATGGLTVAEYQARKAN